MFASNEQNTFGLNLECKSELINSRPLVCSTGTVYSEEHSRPD
jgi:hypothetical protein